MKAISLWQPWATLVATGAKQYETRSWSTTYRGPLIIHAAKRYDDLPRRGKNRNHFIRAFGEADIHFPLTEIPRGAYLCIVDLAEVVATESVINLIADQERAFGDYSSGRFAWRLENVRVFPEPVPARGYQGLWNPLSGLNEPMTRLINDLYASEKVSG